MQIEQYVVGPVQTNCYFAINESTKELVVIDPGSSGKRLADMAMEKGYHPVAVLLTHGHFDHADGVEDFVNAFEHEVPVYAHEAEKDTLGDPEKNVSVMMGAFKSYRADRFVRTDEVLELGGFKVKVLFTPGHTEGGCCFYFMDEACVFCGDSIFAGSIGRTDFPGGSMSTLVRSVQENILTLPEDTALYPGHDSTTDVGREKKYNPFFTLDESAMHFI